MDGPRMHVDVSLALTKGEGPVEYKMPITWRAARRLCEAKCSPQRLLKHARAAGDLDLTEDQVVSIVHTGITEGGAEATPEQVWEAIYIRGSVLEVAFIIAIYIGGFINGGVRFNLAEAKQIMADAEAAEKKKKAKGKSSRAKKKKNKKTRTRGSGSKGRTKRRSAGASPPRSSGK